MSMLDLADKTASTCTNKSKLFRTWKNQRLIHLVARSILEINHNSDQNEETEKYAETLLR
jgi:hypothetical protein